MSDWSIGYVQRPVLGVAVHGVIVIRDGSGRIVKWYEGLATGPDGQSKMIGTSADDTIRLYTRWNSNPPNYATTFPEQTAFVGSEAQVRAKIAVADALEGPIKDANIRYTRSPEA